MTFAEQRLENTKVRLMRALKAAGREPKNFERWARLTQFECEALLQSPQIAPWDDYWDEIQILDSELLTGRRMVEGDI